MAKTLRFRVPDGATSVEIVWDDEKEKPVARWRRKKSDPPDKPSDDSDKPKVSDHLRSFFTGKGKGAFADDADADDEDDVDDVDEDGDDNGKG